MSYGIYGIFFPKDAPNVVYIGSTLDSFKTRFRDHKKSFTDPKRKHSNIYVRDLVEKFGALSAEFRVLEYMFDRNIVHDREKEFIQKYIDEGWVVLNIAPPGAIANAATAELSKKALQTEEVRSKISNTMTGRKHTEAHREAISKAMQKKWDERRSGEE